MDIAHGPIYQRLEKVGGDSRIKRRCDFLRHPEALQISSYPRKELARKKARD